MKTYKILLKEKLQKNRKIEYILATSTDEAEKLAKEKFEDFSIIGVSLERSSTLQFYCNKCRREVNFSDSMLHEHRATLSSL